MYLEGDDSREGYRTMPLTLTERTAQEVGGVIRLLELSPPARILDVPCGYGRHAIELARRGFRVVGVDINSALLARAKEQREQMEKPTDVTFLQRDMRTLPYREKFDAVVNMFFSFGFFEEEAENEQAIRHFAAALKPGGKLLIHTDVNVPRIREGTYKLHEVRTLKNGKKLEIQERYDPQRKRLRGTWAVIGPSGVRTVSPEYSVRVYTAEEYGALCRAVGLRDVRFHGDWDGTPYSETIEDLIVVARK